MSERNIDRQTKRLRQNWVYTHTHTYIYIYIYGQKLKIEVIQHGEIIGKESRRSNVSVLINHPQDFRKDDIECYSINDGYLMKDKGGNYINKETEIIQQFNQ